MVLRFTCDVQQQQSFPYDADVEEEFFLDYNFWVKFIPTMLTLTDHMLLKVTGGFSIEHLLLFRRPRIVEIEETKEQKQSQLKQQQQQKPSCSWFLFLGSSNVLSDVVSTRTTARQMLAFLHLHDFINIFFLLFFFSSLLFPRPIISYFLFMKYNQ